MALDDLRYSLRRLRRAPLAGLAIVLTVALGIGATTAVYSVVHAVLLRPLPFADAERLVWVAERNDRLHLPTFTTSAPNFRSWLADPGPVEGLAAIGYATFNWSGAGEPELLTGGTLTASVFDTLGIAPLLGRGFLESEQKFGAPHVAMISEALWRRRFGGDPAILGRALDLDGVPTEIVGVAPPALALISPGDAWIPMVFQPDRERRLSHLITAIGRLPAGVPLARAQAGMEEVARRVGEQFPETRDWSVRLVTFPNWIVPSQVRTALVTLLVAVVCVLLIAAANIANLLLAKTLEREREAAVRAALGASRWRVLSQLLVESLLLAAIGGLLGIAAAFVTVRWAAAALPANLLPVPDIGMDGGVLAFAVVLTLATGFLFGLAPAWQVARAPVAGALRGGGRGAIGGRRRWLRHALATSEIGLATALLVVAGLLVRSARELGAVELGFDPSHVLTLQINRPASDPAGAARRFGFYRELLPALASLPGVTGAALSSGVPMGAGNYTQTPVRPLGSTQLGADEALAVDWRLASPDYFRVLGIPLLRGRAFTDGDDAQAGAVTIVSESLARRFWGTDDVVGRSVFRPADGATMTVVGVVGDARLTAPSQIAPSMYYSSASRLWPLMDVVIRTAGDPESVVAAVRGRIRALDPTLPVSNVHPLSFWVAASGAQPRLDAGLLSAFSLLALGIAALGIYGVLAHSVAQRTSEIGLRMALGAPRARVVALFLREGMTLGALGIGLGLAAALAAGRLLADLVYGVSTHDAATLAGVTLGLAAVTAVASAVPARRAAGVDPAITLRDP